MKKLLFILGALVLMGCQPIVNPISVLQAGILPEPDAKVAVSCIVRFDANGNPSLEQSSGHTSKGVASVSVQGDYLRINFTESHSISGFVVGRDECTAKIEAVAKGFADYALIQFRQQTKQTVQGRFIYDGTQWNYTQYANTQPIQIITNTPNYIRVSHDTCVLWVGVNKVGPADILPGVGISSKYEESSIFITGNPEIGDALQFKREVLEPYSEIIPLNEVIGGPLCNIQFMLFE